VEELLKKAYKMPRVLFNEMPCFSRQESSQVDLLELMEV